MKERPILFSGEMVRALLAGTKTQTRRAFSPRMIRLMVAAAQLGEVSDFIGNGALEKNDLSYITGLSPYGESGDRLWVRETWRVHKNHDRLPPRLVGVAMGGDSAGCINYVATPRNDEFWGKTRVSIHMPRWASRINLDVVSVRVERLNVITDADAVAEGVSPANGILGEDFLGLDMWRTRLGLRFGESLSCARYAQLWDRLNGVSWAANPWVWVVEFRRAAP